MTRAEWLKALEEADECGLLLEGNGLKYVGQEEDPLSMCLTALRHMAGGVRNGEILLTYAIDHLRRVYPLLQEKDGDLVEEFRWWARAFCALARAQTLEEANQVLDLLLEGDLEEAERHVS